MTGIDKKNRTDIGQKTLTNVDQKIVTIDADRKTPSWCRPKKYQRPTLTKNPNRHQQKKKPYLRSTENIALTDVSRKIVLVDVGLKMLRPILVEIVLVEVGQKYPDPKNKPLTIKINH